MESKTYLLTGASGFLGSTICRQLISAGNKVIAFVLPGDKAEAFIPKGTLICHGNLCDPADVDRFFGMAGDGEFLVIHCASMVTVNPNYNQKVMDVNVNGTKNIIEACKTHAGCRKLVYVGSTGAMPTLKKGIMHREIQRFEPENLPDCYGQSKAIASNHVLDACKDGLDACIVMPTGILGPGDYSISTTTDGAIRIINGEMTIGITGTFNMADVRDLASGVISATEKGRKGESYILGNDVVSFKDYSKLLLEESGKKNIKFFLPCPVARFMAGIMEKKAERNGTTQLLTRYSFWVLSKNNEYDSTKACRELGYRSRSYKETIHDEVMWFKEQGLIS